MPPKLTPSRICVKVWACRSSLASLIFGVILGCGLIRQSPLVERSYTSSIPPGLEPYLVQMHLHGLSNHNGNPLPASMESQTFEAQRNGFDVIWWSDHSRIFESYSEDKTVRFTSGLVEQDSISWMIKLGGLRRGLSLLSARTSGDGCRIDISKGSLLMVFDEIRPGPCERSMILRASSSIGKVKQLDFCRPIATGLELRLWGNLNAIRERMAELRVGFDLCWHPKGQHRLIFEIDQGIPNSGKVIGDTLVVCYAQMDSIGVLQLDLEKAAGLLPMGYDNSLSDIWLELRTSSCSACTVSIDSFAIHSRKPQGQVIYDLVKELARTYQARYKVVEHIGIELGTVHRISNPHINVFLPESTAGLWVIDQYETKPLPQFVRRVHERGGLVCFNHPFGASRIDRSGQVLDDEDLYGAPPINLWRSGMRMDPRELEEAESTIVENSAFGADIIEVGYIFRGKGALEDHLRLWDGLLSKGMRILGSGVSDSHGGKWEREMVPSAFATWIWAYSKSSDDLIDGLRKGRVAFGDPFLWRGKFCFGVKQAIMGDTLLVSEGEGVEAWLVMEPELVGGSVSIVQVRISPQGQVNYVKRVQVSGIPKTIPISSMAPSYVRVEIYDAFGNPVVFSNPVWLVGDKQEE